MPEDVNIADIAAYAGVSISTVSRVLNNHPDVSRKTREKVMQVIHEHSYVPNNSARNLKRESLHAVGVVVKGFSNPFFTQMIEVTQEELTRRKYMAILHPVDPDEDEIDSAISLSKEKKPKGLIFLGGNFQHSREKLALLDVPFAMVTMTMHSQVDRGTFSSITVDDFEEGYRVAKRIIQAGHRNLAAIAHSPGDRSISKLRLDGFKKAMAELGLPPDALTVEYAGDFSMQSGYDAAIRLTGGLPFSCLFCISDTMALGAMRALHEKGFHIPRDVSVVGFDGITASRFAIPSLATVRQPQEEMAYESIRMLLDHMEYGTPHQHRLMRADFIEGESFRPVP